MPKCYVQLDDGTVVGISTVYNGLCMYEAELNEPTINLTKLQGYVYTRGTPNTLTFNEEKYNQYILEQQREEAIKNGNEVFDKLTEQNVLKTASNVDAYAMRYLYPTWSGDSVKYEKNDRLMYNDKFYKVLQTHTSQPDWTPDTAVSQFVEIPDPNVEYPEWKQPISAETAYSIGDKVIFEGKKYISLINANTWSPKEYPSGWQLVEE